MPIFINLSAAGFIYFPIAKFAFIQGLIVNVKIMTVGVFWPCKSAKE
jgi:hypothetical protein